MKPAPKPRPALPPDPPREVADEIGRILAEWIRAERARKKRAA